MIISLFSGRCIKLISISIMMLIANTVMAQEIDLLIKNGHVIDPKNKIDEPMDVAIAGGKILKVARNISSSDAKKTIDATGMFVTPGFIDLHTHVFVGNNPGFADGFSCVSPDDITLKSGITTVVDAGTSGWRNFPLFRKNIIDRSTTRVLAFLNIAGSGMTGFPSEEDINDMDAHMTSLVIKQYPDIIVGVKIGHFRGKEWTPFERSVEACEIANVPLFLECHLPEYHLDDLLARMRSGDIFSHTYCTASDRECILDSEGKLRKSVLEAQKKGILFDVGHGGGMFHFDVAIPALKQGLVPSSFGSDLHRSSMNSGMKSMLETMTKFLNMGMSLNDVVYTATWSSANAIKRSDIGNLGEGAVADIALISIRKGTFGLLDTKNTKLIADRRLEAEMTIRAGKIVWDLNGLAAREVAKK